ncbi:MAG: hypothetical protein IJL68_00750 [Bacteroidales bacterium]|nr:hypothetical protein [Bacteroidales bacterium]
MKQETYYVVDSLGVAHPETIDVQPWTLSRFFVEGGMTGMILISLMLIALFLAAWKAPRWVREIGIGALVLSVFLTLMGLFQIFGVTEMFGDISFAVISGGLKVAMIPLFYGLIVYFISLIIRVIQTPRI